MKAGASAIVRVSGAHATVERCNAVQSLSVIQPLRVVSASYLDLPAC